MGAALIYAGRDRRTGDRTDMMRLKDGFAYLCVGAQNREFEYRT